MPKRSRTKPKPKKPARDENQSAYDLIKRIEELTALDGEEGKDPLAVALGRRGGLAGGKARAAKLTPEQRRKSASKAANARWARERARSK